MSPYGSPTGTIARMAHAIPGGRAARHHRAHHPAHGEGPEDVVATQTRARPQGPSADRSAGHRAHPERAPENGCTAGVGWKFRRARRRHRDRAGGGGYRRAGPEAPRTGQRMVAAPRPRSQSRGSPLPRPRSFPACPNLSCSRKQGTGSGKAQSTWESARAAASDSAATCSEHKWEAPSAEALMDLIASDCETCLQPWEEYLPKPVRPTLTNPTCQPEKAQKAAGI